MRVVFLLAIFLCVFSARTMAETLMLQNDTDQEVINILIQPEQGTPFFARLDLLPGEKGEIENPDCTARLRIDTGIELWNFPEINLQEMNRLVFSGKGTLWISANDRQHKIEEIKGIPLSLAPAPGERPVCSLTKLRPAMPMKEVCSFLPGEILHDDNGAVLAGLGYGNMTWAARIIPESPGQATEDSLLEHIELRRTLEPAALNNLLKTLEKQGYVPWQAEFPGKDLELASLMPDAAYSSLEKAISSFLADNGSQEHKNHASEQKCAQASIILAPADMLPSLDNSDEPPADVQIFTVMLRPCTNLLLLDVAAYKGQNQED